MAHPLPRVEQRMKQMLPRVLEQNMRITRSMAPVITDVPTRLFPCTRCIITHCRRQRPAYLSHSPQIHRPKILVPKLRPPPNLPYLQPTTHDHALPAFQCPCQSPTLNLLAWCDWKTKSTKHLQDWTISLAKEFGRLAQGVGGCIKGTDTIRFIRKSDILQDCCKDVTYGHFVCNVRPEKLNPITHVSLWTATKSTTLGKWPHPQPKCSLPNFCSVTSTPSAKFMTMDLSNFHLMALLPRPEYLRLKLSNIPTEIITEYCLDLLAEPDGTIYVLMQLGMYGLPHAGLLANELLEKRFNAQGYHQSKLVPGLWNHIWHPIQFTLVVDDFGIKYVGQEHPQHLLSVLQEH
eukprot:CCRYP_014976-RA/>CCRYP_014976-RA protein AED:0.39 eAED:0.37 QI:0/0/0/1/0/0/2/0/347